jgi:hypothetical protein
MINQIHNMPKRIKRNGRVLDKLKKVRELLRLHGAINEIIPEADGVTLIWMANSHTPKLSVKPEDVLHQKEPFSLARCGTKQKHFIMVIQILVTLEGSNLEYFRRGKNQTKETKSMETIYYVLKEKPAKTLL